MKRTCLFLLVMATAICTHLKSQTCAINDSLALVSLYQSTDGANWHISWNLNISYRHWFGVRTNAQGCVTEIRLERNNLRGNLPDELVNLSELDSIDLSENRINGFLPTAWEDMERLRFLDLSENEIRGTIPYAFTGIATLRYIDFSENNLDGFIPSGISALGNLEVLRLNDNGFFGDLPAEFEDLPRLRIFEARENRLTGAIPEEWGQIRTLEKIDLAYNLLYGELPTSLTDLSELTYLDLSFNDIRGELPADIGMLTKLTHLLLGYNQLSGNLPASITDLVSLEYLNLRNNEFDGPLPADIGMLSQLIELCLQNNAFSGMIPPSIGQLSSLKKLDVSGNALSGRIPSSIESLRNLEYVRFCPNDLRVPIPDLSGNPRLSLKRIDWSCLKGAGISGHVYGADTFDCQNINGFPLPHVRVSAGTQFTFTDDSGYYQLLLDTGNYELRAEIPNAFWQVVCPDSGHYDIHIPDLSTRIDDLDFGMKTALKCAVPRVKLSMPRYRWCNNNVMTMTYENYGLDMDTNAVIELDLPAGSEIRFSSHPYDHIGGGMYRFVLPSLASGQSGEIRLHLFIACNPNTLGRAFCPKAAIYPRYDCPPAFPLPPYNVHVAGHCEFDTAVFTLTNSGTQSVSSYFLVYKDNVRIDSAGISLMAGESRELRYYPNDGTYILVLSDGDSDILNDPWEGIEPCQAGAPTTNYLALFTNRGPWHESRLCGTIRGSYDPNEKTAKPDGDNKGLPILPNTELQYFIHFQNTGNDTAFRVEIQDVIRKDVFNIETLRPGPSSHPYKMHYQRDSLKFIIDPIALPDSTTNEKESQGYVSFYIKQKADLPDFTEISNRANIIFDHNPAIVTNTLKHIVRYPEIKNTSVTWDPTRLQIVLSPNPSKGRFIIKGSDFELIKATDMNGHDQEFKRLSENEYYIGSTGTFILHLRYHEYHYYRKLLILGD